MCQISLQKKKKNFLKRNSRSVLANLKTYGKLLNQSAYLISLTDEELVFLQKIKTVTNT